MVENKKPKGIPKTCIFGGRGFLGSYFYKAYTDFHVDTITTSHLGDDVYFQLDLEKPLIDHLPLDGYEYGIIAAAIVDLAYCEDEKEKSFRCNVDGTLKLARKLSERGIIPILFSSDYVFDGKKGDYTENDVPCPINEYGRQKFELEKKISSICKDEYLLIRLSKVFGLNPGDGTLLDEIATRLIHKKIVRAAYDQIFSPVWVGDVFNAILALQKQGCRGLYNVCGQTTLSRLEIVHKLAAQLGVDENLIESISLGDLSDRLLRPRNTSLNQSKLIATTSVKETSLDFCIAKIAEIHQISSQKGH